MLRDAGSQQLAASDRWQTALAALPATDLASVADQVSSERVDTKYVLRSASILRVLESLASEFLVLDIDGTRFTTYRTQYFDTESYALFRRHHAGGSNRCKVRTRTYLNTGLAYVEVKRKRPTGATTKLRHRIPKFSRELSGEIAAFVDANCTHQASSLLPSLCNRFDRIFLVGKDRSERLTIDLDIAIETDERPMLLPGVAIAELKQERHTHHLRDTPFQRAMRELHVRPSGFSKYCMGLLLTQPKIKHNLFRPQLRKLRQLMGEPNAVC
jgi:hypothetical protein